ncbi:ALI motif gene family protein [Betaentomopoxvirus amoorei]|uniref:AMV257 n=1 Tax=Amsacta moorei entomopoxvirus TaxID=28321 RepID=Q9EME9_AMEPV|nr:ALI motif gene family protein [Amsacta moorei entomopoxvirus]AAG02963.1 AMV257 [Amsacta moorei entomopoxvirus]
MENIIDSFIDTNQLILPNNIDNINLNLNIIHNIEDDSINNIYKALYKYNKVLKYIVKNYKIDLYILDVKLAIECVNNNKILCIDYEKEKIIKNELKCTFYKYNPNDKNFCIFKTIGEIFDIINKK